MLTRDLPADELNGACTELVGADPEVIAGPSAFGGLHIKFYCERLLRRRSLQPDVID
jgi:hypothetical protein